MGKPSRGWGERSKTGQKQAREKEAKLPRGLTNRAALKEHLPCARGCTRHFLSYRLMPARVLHLQWAPNKHLLMDVNSSA